MLEPHQLHEYQQKAVNHQCSHIESALWLDMGLGKTVITLTSIKHLLNTGFLNGVIVVAPIRVIRMVWRQEALKWSHTHDLKFSMVAGTKDQRTRALLRDADVYLINYENLRWLGDTLNTYFIKKDKPLPFNGVVWDELSKMKNSNTQRVKSVLKILPHMKWLTGLTGTPASNGYKDLHGQFLVLDKGERLGTSKTAFKTRFYRKVGPFKEVPYDDTETIIKDLIGDITLEMSAADYNPLPDLIINDINVDMPDNIRIKYDQMEKDFFTQLDNGTDVEVFNQAALTNKCLQMANGNIYPISGLPMWEPVHDLKIEALEDIIEEAAGSPILCAYAYRSDAERIMQHFKNIDPINLTDCKSETALANAMSRWKSGDCQLMIGHPACLHSDTLVFTERNGWTRIIDVGLEDRVFDGIEFVSHDGCNYSGYKEVIDVFGITMTPDHKILINDKWVEARHVRNSEEVKNEALFKWEETVGGSGEMSEVRDRIRNDASKCYQTQSKRWNILPILYSRYFSSNDRHSNMEGVVRINTTSKQSARQELRWSWNNCVVRLGKIRKLLSGYARWVFGRTDNRTHRCKQRLLQRELPMGDQYGATGKQAEQSGCGISWRKNTPGGVSEKIRIQQNHVEHSVKPRNEWRRGCARLSKITLWKERHSKKCKKEGGKKAHVYDLVNCGSRHRFLIKNDKGEMFISHNSMGHGIDGLQKNGHILVWFGLNWSLDLYEQFNARVRRQGQGVPVICHRLLINNTLDQVQAAALDEKAQTQSSLRNVIKEYRKHKGV